MKLLLGVDPAFVIRLIRNLYEILKLISPRKTSRGLYSSVCPVLK